MSDAALVSNLVLAPIAFAFFFGAILKLLETKQHISSRLISALCVSNFAILSMILAVSKVSLGVETAVFFKGFFKADVASLNTAIAASFLFLFIYLFSECFTLTENSGAKLLNLLGFFLALNFSQNLILIFILSEIFLFLSLKDKNDSLGSLNSDGLRVRLVGLILILGSIAINYGAGQASSLDFLKSSAADLYSSDYLFLIGCLFVFSGMIKMLLSLFERESKKFNSYALLAGLCFITTVLKYSSAQIFSVLQETQVLSQWLCVLALMYSIYKLSSVRFLVEIVKYAFLSSIMLCLVFNLSFVFDGQGYNHTGLIYFLGAAVAALTLLSLEARLASFKGDKITLKDLRGLSVNFPKKSFLICFAVFSILAFPFGSGFLVLSSGLKLTFQTGFYWLGFWSLFSMVGLWSVCVHLFNEIYKVEQCDGQWALWKNKEVTDSKNSQILSLTVFILTLPVVFIFLSKV